MCGKYVWLCPFDDAPKTSKTRESRNVDPPMKLTELVAGLWYSLIAWFKRRN